MLASVRHGPPPPLPAGGADGVPGTKGVIAGVGEFSSLPRGDGPTTSENQSWEIKRLRKTFQEDRGMYTQWSKDEKGEIGSHY